MLAQTLDGEKNLIDNGGRQSLEWLVEQDQLLWRHQSAGDCQHLPLAATKIFTTGILVRTQPGKQVIDVRDGPSAVARGQNKVLADRQIRKDASAFRYHGDAEPIDPIRGQMGDVHAIENATAVAGPQR